MALQSVWPGSPVKWPWWPSQRPGPGWRACCGSCPQTPSIPPDRSWTPPCPGRRSEGWSEGRCRWTRTLHREGWRRTCHKKQRVSLSQCVTEPRGDSLVKVGSRWGRLWTESEDVVKKKTANDLRNVQCLLCLLMAYESLTILQRGGFGDKSVSHIFWFATVQKKQLHPDLSLHKVYTQRKILVWDWFKVPLHVAHTRGR